MQMSRILTCSVWLAAIGGSLCVAGGCRERNVPSKTTRASTPPETRLKQHIGLVLPKEARNAKCYTQALMVQWVYARFDVPLAILPDLLASPPLDRLPILSTNPQLVAKLRVTAAEVAWWDVSANESVTASRASWRRKEKSGNWEYTLSICVDRKADAATIYLQHIKEPIRSGP